LPANQIFKAFRENGISRYVTCPLFIDELGREQVEVNDFGNRIRPFNQLMEMRYETGARTFFTSNFSMATLSKEKDENGKPQQGYGEYINERVQEMTNMVVLPGTSRRKKWGK
jgi:DNA replication protein DnaC